MITISTGRDVRELLARVYAAPEAFSSVAICSPFIDEEEAFRLARLMARADRVGCGVRVVTTRRTAAMLKQLPQRYTLVPEKAVTVSERLHAKVYLAISRRPRSSEAIVTSANLTRGGLRKNRELGVRARNTCDAGTQLIHTITLFVQQLAASLPRI